MKPLDMRIRSLEDQITRSERYVQKCQATADKKRDLLQKLLARKAKLEQSTPVS